MPVFRGDGIFWSSQIVGISAVKAKLAADMFISLCPDLLNLAIQLFHGIRYHRDLLW